MIAVTDLLDGDQYPAAAIMELYLHRWQIETVFQEITELFYLRKLIGCTPEAVTFQAAFCMVIYNIVQVMKAYVAKVGPSTPLTVMPTPTATARICRSCRARTSSSTNGSGSTPTPTGWRVRRARQGGMRKSCDQYVIRSSRYCLSTVSGCL